MGLDPLSWAVIGGGAAILGGAAIGANASSKAASAQENAINKAAETTEESSQLAREQEWKMWEEQKALQEPFRTAGIGALSTLQQKMVAGPGEFTQSPGYLSRLTEGESGINRALASRGMYDSGKALTALTRYNQDYATNDYQNFLNNYYQSLQPYQTLVGTGNQTAVTLGNQAGQVGSNLANIEMSRGNALADAYVGAGNARASGYINAGNAWGGALNQAGTLGLLYGLGAFSSPKGIISSGPSSRSLSSFGRTGTGWDSYLLN